MEQQSLGDHAPGSGSKLAKLCSVQLIDRESTVVGVFLNGFRVFPQVVVLGGFTCAGDFLLGTWELIK